jgi:hypothetical protein
MPFYVMDAIALMWHAMVRKNRMETKQVILFVTCDYKKGKETND